MNKSTQIGLSIGLAVVCSILGIGLSENKLLGAMIGFGLPLFIIGLFHVWIKYGISGICHSVVTQE